MKIAKVRKSSLGKISDSSMFTDEIQLDSYRLSGFMFKTICINCVFLMWCRTIFNAPSSNSW